MKYDGCVVGSTLRRLRNEKNVTLEKMSSMTGISTSAIKQYEQGGRQISIKNLYVLIEFFGVDANTILNVTTAEKDVSIDERLREMDKQKRDYLKETFLFMVEQAERACL